MAEIEIWSELDHEFKLDGQGNLKKVINVEAVKSSIMNILGTRQGQRLFFPTFAEAFSSMLFEPIDSHLSSFLSNQMKQVIEQWDDRVTVISSDFQSNPDANSVSVTLYIAIRGYQDVFSIEHQF